MRPGFRLLLWGPILLVLACADDPAGSELSTCATVGPTVDIVDNHLPSGGDHVLIVPREHVLEGVERTYDIRGDNMGHTHTVTLTAGDFASLQAGTTITLVSSNNGPEGIGHDHTINLSCP